MAYVVPIHRPNSVRHAIRARLFPDEEDCLVLAKANRLEIWKLEETGLVISDSRVIHGTISMLQKLRPRDADTDLLFVGTDRFQYFTVMWNPDTRRLETVDSFFDIYEKHMRDSQSQDKCFVDPSGRFMIVLLWEGVLNVLRMMTQKSKRRNIEWMDQVRINELFIKSATFLHVETGHPKVAILYQSRTDVPDSWLVTYRLTTDDKNTQVSRFDVKDQVDRMEIQDPGAALLIPVGKGEEDQKRYIIRNDRSAKAQLGGLIVVGETRLLYYDDAAKKTVESGLKESSIFVAWAEYDVSHYFIGDDYGNLWLLEILLDGAVVTDLEMKKIGVTSRANSIVYMGHDILFVGSHYGDSQVFRVDVDAGTLDLLSTQQNISPVLDFNIMDLGGREGEGRTTNEYSSGQARIVTGSGVHKDGSIRSVRSGVGLDDIGELAEMDNVRTVFALTSSESAKADTLILSFLTESRIFKFSPSGEIEEVEGFKSMVLDEQTLVAQNLSNGRILQATPSSVLLIDGEGGVVLSTWKPLEGQIITNISVNDDWVLLSIDGKILKSLRIQQDIAETESKDLADQDQVACIHLPPQYPQVGVVGFWKTGSISIVDLETLQPLHSESLRRSNDNASVPRDIVLAQILPPDRSGPTLFVAMEDGFVITFNVSKTDFSLSGRKSVVLGTRHAKLQLLPRSDGVYNVFSSSEHPSLIYGSEGRIIYSAVTAEDASCVCAFDSEAFPDSIVVATDKVVKLSMIDNQRRTHVTPLAMGETVRRLAYSRNERAFGLGCVKREVVDNEEVITSSFKLVDEVIFDKLGKDFVFEGAEGTELIEAVIRAEVSDSYGKPAERFIVGTSFINDESEEGPMEVCGRIIVMGIDSDRNPYMITSRDLKGACRALAMTGDHIVAALAKTIVVYSYRETSTVTADLARVASYRPSTYPVDLAVEGNMIVVADLTKSMTVVEFTPAADGEPAKLKEVARHYQSAWSTAIGHIDGQTWLEADAQGNLLVLEQNKAGVTREDKRRMEAVSEMNLGEMVNRIRKVTVDSSQNAVVVPRAFLGTVEGAIYLFGTVAKNQQDLLLRFQTKLANTIETTGNLLFSQYRSFRNEERESDGPFRFIDGELLERFLDMDEKIQEETCEGLGPDVETMRNLVEGLKRLH